jgi:uncharacterized protein
MSRHFLIAPILYLSILPGCVTLPDSPALYQEPPAAWEVEQNNSRLRDMAFLIQKGRSYTAKQQAEAINPAQLSLPQQTQYNLLYAQIFLSSGDAELALAKLSLIRQEQLTQADKIKFLQSKAFAYSLTGNLLESAKARISLDELLAVPTERKQNQAKILETLGFLPQSNNPKAQSPTAGLAPWIAAANILAAKNRNPTEFNEALAKWKASYPDHPANFYMVTVPKANEALDHLPRSIAVLLPESGPYADAAKAIKAGFLAAHEHYHSNQTDKPNVIFYDTEKTKAAELYNQAIKDGAQLIVGPLNKDNIQNLANAAVLNVPVLALNHVPSLNKTNLYQFALSPIDDTVELSQRAAADGHKRALILVPDNELGKRVAAYITNEWQSLGGIVLEKQIYQTNSASDFAIGLKKLLNLAENSTTPQDKSASRHDADVLFLSAYNKEGRAINSQLKALSEGISVYALPNIYGGLIDSSNDAALDGITFCDTPWLFNGSYNGELSMLALHQVWNKYPTTYIRLIAMGIDAYHLAAKLPTLTSTPYSGATGNLSLAAGNRIKRNLVCAKFAQGRPEILGFARDAKTGEKPGATPAIPAITPSP